jgi:DNA-directed RNA polymerase subunit RPC12/RpoP
MPMQGEQVYGTYRCPVCGHREEVEMGADEPARRIDCSYCNTALTVSPRGHDSVRFAVRVAGIPERK